jgi:hypothetical protein
MECYEHYEFPISIPDLALIEAIVANLDPFCAVGCEAGADVNKTLTWRRQTAFYGTEICALFDRNVLLDVLEIVRGSTNSNPQPLSERARFGAALMVFLQCSNIVIEPSLALYEHPSTAKQELVLFRQADNVKSEFFNAIALSRANCLPPGNLPPARTAMDVDFSIRPKGYQNVLIGLLKIATLDLSSLKPSAKMRAFLEWSHSEFLSMTALILLAGMHFTPWKKASVIKGVRSRARDKALVSIHNAARDVMMLVEWNRRMKIKEANRYWLFCSRDHGLKELARTVHANPDVSRSDALTHFWRRYWPTKDADEIARIAEAHYADRSNPERPVNQGFVTSQVDKLHATLESQFLSQGFK